MNGQATDETSIASTDNPDDLEVAKDDYHNRASTVKYLVDVNGGVGVDGEHVTKINVTEADLKNQQNPQSATFDKVNGKGRLSLSESPTTEDNEQKPTSKRRSRLSLNPDAKGKNSKFKEDGGQATLKSFFEKMSPKPGDNKTVLVKNQEKSAKLTEKSDEDLSLKENKPENKNYTNHETLKTHKKKRKKKQRTSNKEILASENSPTKEINLNRDSTVTKDTELQEETGNDDNKLKDLSDSKKVRFSEQIQEYSPERKKVTNASPSRLDNEIEPNILENDPKNEDIKLTEADSVSFEADSDRESPKNMMKNAFTFMMDSRHKSIGQNSPGKELENEEELPEVRKAGKKKMSARKAVFQVWANAKGAKKRKIEDEEKGLVIENKLKKRAKRMKKMLTQNPKKQSSTYSDDDKDVNKSEIKTKKRKLTQILTSDSDSEAVDRNKFVVEAEHNNKKQKRGSKESEQKKEKSKRQSKDSEKPSEIVEAQDKKTKHKPDSKITENTSEIEAKNKKSKHKQDLKIIEKTSEVEAKDKKEKHRQTSKAEEKTLEEVEAKDKKTKHKLHTKITEKTPEEVEAKDEKAKHRQNSKATEKAEVKKQKHKRDSKTIEKTEAVRTKTEKETNEPHSEDTEKPSEKVKIKNKKPKHKRDSKTTEKPEEVQATEKHKRDSKSTGKTSEVTDKKEKRKRDSEDMKKSSQKDQNNLTINKNDDDDTAVDDEMFVKCKKPKLLLSSDNSSSSTESSVTSEAKFVTNSNHRASLQQTDLSSFFAILTKNTNSGADNKVQSKLQMKRNLSNSDFRNGETKKDKRKLKSKLTLKRNSDVVTSDDITNSFVEVEAHKAGEIIVELTETTFVEDDEEGTSATSQHQKQLDILTPRSIKQWRMRLKMNLSDVDDETMDKLVHPYKNNKTAESIEDSKKLQKTKKKLVLDLESELDSDDEPLASRKFCNEKVALSEKTKPVKLAPLFIKSKPKSRPAKIDKVTLEARRKFLHSSMPESFKKTIEQQQRLDEIEYEIFPLISHITVRPTEDQLKNANINFWNLPATDLKLTTSKPYSPKPGLLNLGSITTSTTTNNTNIQLQTPHQLTNLKTLLKQLKHDNPTYPVYKAFKFLHQKNSRISNDEPKTKLVEEETNIKSKKSRKGRSKKRKKTQGDDVEIVEVPEQPQLLVDPSKQEIWTDKYRPCTSDEIFGNHASVSQFKKWLETWLEFSEEINLQRSKRRRANSGSSSDFESTDGESREGLRLPGNTVILYGPHGSGKTTAVYALCSELGINVLELNASSKRTGKRLLQELQEATQSHQVRKNDSSSLSTFLKKDEPSFQNTDSQSSTSTKKMCLLLIEDVDIVFEQDENFITALAQLLTTSKRPLVLTTTDKNCLHLKKFLTQYPIMSFTPLSSRILGTWLQVLCLVEGLQVDRQALVELLERNRGDVRRTLLQLQFWVQSGGQAKLPEGDSTSVDYSQTETSKANCEGFLCNDDSCNLVWFKEDVETKIDVEVNNTTHSNCLETFKYFKNYNQLFISLPLDLSNIWWNLSNWLCIPHPLRRVKNVTEVVDGENPVLDNEKNVTQSAARTNTKETQSKHLLNILNIFETLSMTDVMHETLNIDCNIEPVYKNKDTRLKNSLELRESMEESCYASRDLAYELSHTALNGYVKLYKSGCKDIDRNTCTGIDEKWCTRQNKCEEALLGAVPFFCRLDRGSVSLDYLSTLRTMARSEDVRASNNNKRRNRFYNYLRGVGVSYNDSIYQTACRVFHNEN